MARERARQLPRRRRPFAARDAGHYAHRQADRRPCQSVRAQSADAGTARRRMRAESRSAASGVDDGPDGGARARTGSPGTAPAVPERLQVCLTRIDEPFFFGNSKQPLYGVYHPPRAHTARPTAVVLCYPLWQEYMRAHRVQAAGHVAQQGRVLGAPLRLLRDRRLRRRKRRRRRLALDARITATAIDELKDTAGVTKVSLVGLRVGARWPRRSQPSGKISTGSSLGPGGRGQALCGEDGPHRAGGRWCAATRRWGPSASKAFR